MRSTPFSAASVLAYGEAAIFPPVVAGAVVGGADVGAAGMGIGAACTGGGVDTRAGVGVGAAGGGGPEDGIESSAAVGTKSLNAAISASSSTMMHRS